MSQPNTAPVTFDVTYPISLSRPLLLLKTFLGWLYVGIPHGIILYLYGILAGLASLIAFFAILFTRQYPLGLFNFVVGYLRWNARVSAYLTFMVDKYPPFSSTDPGHPVELEVANPEKLSRPLAVLKLFLGWFYVGIPHGVALIFLWHCRPSGCVHRMVGHFVHRAVSPRPIQVRRGVLSLVQPRERISPLDA